MQSSVQDRPATDVQQDSTCPVTPRYVKMLIDKSRDIEQAWMERTAEITGMKIEGDPTIKPLPRKQHRHKQPLSPENIALLTAGTVPNGVNWKETKLTRGQRTLLREAKARRTRLKARRDPSIGHLRLRGDALDSVILG